MPKIDKITYPEGVKEMLKDRYIGPMFRDYLDKKICAEIYVYIDEAMKKRDPKTQFKKFFAAGAKYEINIGSEPLLGARRLAAAKDWKSKDWKKIYDLADGYVVSLANGEHDSKFYKEDDAFKAHHVYMLQKRNLRQNYPALMTDLNTADKKAVANVAALLQADKKAGAKATKVLMKKNKVTKKMPAVIKMFKKTFKISA